VDSRAAVEATELIQRGLADEIYATAGDWVAITSAPRLLWLQRHEPEIVARAAHLTMLGDWILYRLSGRYVTDPSLGSSSGLFDLAARGWSGRLLEICGLQAAVCPEVLEPGTVIGGVRRQAADETGLAEGTPVVVGGADTQLGLVGIGTSTGVLGLLELFDERRDLVAGELPGGLALVEPHGAAGIAEVDVSGVAQEDYDNRPRPHALVAVEG